MDTRTGDTYATELDALKAGVPSPSIAKIVGHVGETPVIQFASGPFKGRFYKRMPTGQLVRVYQPNGKA